MHPETLGTGVIWLEGGTIHIRLQAKTGIESPVRAMIAVEHQHAAIGCRGKVPGHEVYIFRPLQESRIASTVEVEDEQPSVSCIAYDEVVVCRYCQSTQ